MSHYTFLETANYCSQVGCGVRVCLATSLGVRGLSSSMWSDAEPISPVNCLGVVLCTHQVCGADTDSCSAQACASQGVCLRIKVSWGASSCLYAYMSRIIHIKYPILGYCVCEVALGCSDLNSLLKNYLLTKTIHTSELLLDPMISWITFITLSLIKVGKRYNVHLEFLYSLWASVYMILYP